MRQARAPAPSSAKRWHGVQVLELLYDADVIEEDAFYKWAEEKRNADEEDRLFLAKAAKFLKWLKEAEEEEEDDGDDEEDDEE